MIWTFVTLLNLCQCYQTVVYEKTDFRREITIFKSLAISKIVYLALLTTNPNSVIEELKQIHKMFLWGNKNPKSNTILCVTNIKWWFEKCRFQSSQFKMLLGKKVM